MKQAVLVTLAVMLLQFNLSFGTPIAGRRSWDDSDFKLVLTPVSPDGMAPNVDETVDNMIEEPIEYANNNLELKFKEELKMFEGCDCSGISDDLDQVHGMDENIVEGDIILTPEQMVIYKESGWDGLMDSEAWNPGAAKWEKTIPYVADSDLDSKVVSALEESIEMYQKDSCLKFVKRTSEPTYMHFKNGDGCSSGIGKPASGARIITLGPKCLKAKPAHEIFHALGRHHEQSRPDRDEYVIIHDDNIKEGKENNFRKVSNADTQSLSYDYDSIMHYSARAFRKAPGLCTITPKDSSIDCSRLGQREKMSETDIKQVNARYCSETAMAWV